MVLSRALTTNSHVMVIQAAGLSHRETTEVMDTYVREQVEEKGAGEKHMYAPSQLLLSGIETVYNMRPTCHDLDQGWGVLNQRISISDCHISH